LVSVGHGGVPVSTPGPKVKTPVGDAPVVPVILLAVGMELCWFAIHYWGSDTAWPTDPVKAVLQGRPIPTPQRTDTPAQVAAIGAAAAAAANAATAAASAAAGAANPNILAQAVASGTGAGSAIASDALRYVGAGYQWGGNASTVGDWDCSSFVSYVLGHDLGLALPGGGRWGDPGYPPHAHGPTSGQYMLFGTGIDRSQVQAGDLIATVDHIGIAISGSTMVSAQDTQLGTGIGSFPGGFPGGTPVYRRVSGAAANPYPGGISGRA
jgi:cell wall-associated NlpC family hydrolase